jgi:hypothetical protein
MIVVVCEPEWRIIFGTEQKLEMNIADQTSKLTASKTIGIWQMLMNDCSLKIRLNVLSILLFAFRPVHKEEQEEQVDSPDKNKKNLSKHHTRYVKQRLRMHHAGK